MQRRLKLQNYRITKLHNPQSGYMLITLMLMVALAALALLAVLPDVAQQIKRDQEEEMCNRGTQYMRAIQHFYKKFGRYPTRVEELENTSNLRFLRKRYKDPLMHDAQGKEKDFKLLHMQDITTNNGPALGGLMGGQQPSPGQIPGQNSPSLNPGGGGAEAAAEALEQAQQQGSTGTVQNAQNKNSDDESDSPSPQPGSPSSPGGSSPFNSGSTTGTGQNNTVFGGGPILGVASLSKAPTIRVYNKKEHYNDWIFIYDPTSDRGGLLVGPWQTPNTSTIPGATPAGQMPGTQPQSGFGQSVGGQSQGLQSPQQNQQPQPTPQQ